MGSAGGRKATVYSQMEELLPSHYHTRGSASKQGFHLCQNISMSAVLLTRETIPWSDDPVIKLCEVT